MNIRDFSPDPGWTTVVDGPLIAQIKTLHSAELADALRQRMLAHLASESQPELSDIHIVRGPEDYRSAMQPFVTAFLDGLFAGRLASVRSALRPAAIRRLRPDRLRPAIDRACRVRPRLQTGARKLLTRDFAKAPTCSTTDRSTCRR